MENLKQKIVDNFNQFDGKNLNILNDFYADNVTFADPVTHVKGLKNLKEYYSKVYKNVKSIHFEFGEIINDQQSYAAPWTLHLSAKGLNGGKEYEVQGMSHFKFNNKGLVIYHRDYLDLGEMVYEKLPIQGLIIKSFKKLMGHH
jgi:hypothetical protein